MHYIAIVIISWTWCLNSLYFSFTLTLIYGIKNKNVWIQLYNIRFYGWIYFCKILSRENLYHCLWVSFNCMNTDIHKNKTIKIKSILYFKFVVLLVTKHLTMFFVFEMLFHLFIFSTNLPPLLRSMLFIFLNKYYLRISNILIWSYSSHPFLSTSTPVFTH